MNITDLLKMEQEHRKSQKWLMWQGEVTNDNGVVVQVAIKSYGFYNQILRINNDGIDYASSHSISKVKAMQKHLRDTINSVKA